MPILTPGQERKRPPCTGAIIVLIVALLVGLVSGVPFATPLNWQTDSADWSLWAEWREPSLYYASWKAGAGPHEWRLQLGWGYYCLQRDGD